jgi:hypothetical protein
MQGGLALLACVLGLAAAWQEGDWRWLAGAVLIGLAWPYTLLAVQPTNRRLKSVTAMTAGGESRALLRQWGRLHLVRAALGAAAVATYLWPLA